MGQLLFITVFVLVGLCMYVCLCIQIKKVINRFEKILFFLGRYRQYKKFPTQRRAAKNSINRRKTCFFGLPRQYFEDLLTDFDENGPKE